MQRQDIITKLESLLDARNVAQAELQIKESAFQRFHFQVDKITARNKYARIISKTMYMRNGQETEGTVSSPKSL